MDAGKGFEYQNTSLIIINIHFSVKAIGYKKLTNPTS
jgi:hypothetical protein